MEIERWNAISGSGGSIQWHQQQYENAGWRKSGTARHTIKWSVRKIAHIVRALCTSTMKLIFFSQLKDTH